MTDDAKPRLLGDGADMDVRIGIVDGHVLVQFGEPVEAWLALPPDSAKALGLEIVARACEIDAANRSETTP